MEVLSSIVERRVLPVVEIMAEKRNTIMKSVELSSAPDPLSQEPLLRQGSVNMQRTKIYSTRKYPPFRTTIAAVVMLVGGVVFLSLAFASFLFYKSADAGKCLGLLIIGCLLFLPGSYASTIIYGTFLGWHGYDYSMVPSYDE